MRSSRTAGTLHVGWLLVALLAAWGPARAQQSATYTMERVTFSSAGGTATSADYATVVTFGEVGPTGAASACNAGFATAAGFPSVLGTPPVPVVLQVAEGAPGTIQLSWSGNDDAFDVFRGTLSASVGEPGNLLLTTSGCDAMDAPPPDELLFYIVRAHP